MVLTNSPLLIFALLIGAFIVSLLIIQHPKVAKSLGFIYAALEGLALGVISQTYNARGITASCSRR